MEVGFYVLVTYFEGECWNVKIWKKNRQEIVQNPLNETVQQVKHPRQLRKGNFNKRINIFYGRNFTFPLFMQHAVIVDIVSISTIGIFPLKYLFPKFEPKYICTGTNRASIGTSCIHLLSCFIISEKSRVSEMKWHKFSWKAWAGAVLAEQWTLYCVKMRSNVYQTVKKKIKNKHWHCIVIGVQNVSTRFD